MDTQFSLDQAKEVLDNGIAQAQEMISDPSKIQDLLGQIEAKVKELPAVAGSAWGNVPVMISMIKSYITKDYAEVSPKVVALLVSAFIYLVKKNDLIKDSVPLLGHVDDLAVITLALKLCEPELAAYAQGQEQHKQG